MKSKKVATYGLLLALAFLLSYIEAILPLPIPIPGIKLGLANLVVLTALYTMGVKEAFVLSLIRIILVGFTFGNTATMIYSFAGGFLSWGLMTLFSKTKLFSITGVSIVGGISHNIGQIVVAIWVVNNVMLINYLPILFVSGTVTGTVIGLLGFILVDRIKKMEISR